MLDWARRTNVTLNELDARSASLESVFLSFVDNDPQPEDSQHAQDGVTS